MLWKRGWIGALLLLSASAVGQPVAAQVEFTSGAMEIDLGGRFQTQFIGSSCSSFVATDTSSLCSEDVPGLDMFVRRARLELEVKVNDWISGRIQPDFGDVDGVELKDAFGQLDLSPGSDADSRIRIGHFKKPFDGFQLTSSTQILTIERDLDIPGVSGTTALSLDELTTRNRLSDRDIGFMFDAGDAADRFHFWVGVFNAGSTTDNGDVDTQKQLVSRAQVNLTAGEHPLSIAGAVAVTDVPFTRSDETLDNRYVANVELWAELGDWSDGPHVQAGLVLGKNRLQNELGASPDLEAGDPLASMLTWQAIGSWKFATGGDSFIEAIEPLFRVTVSDPNRDLSDDTVTGFTPGIQFFFDGRNKLALNWDFVSFGLDGVDSESSFKAQYQFHF